VKAGNAEVTAQAVRKESKSAGKLLLSKVGKTLMGPVGLAIGKTDLNAIHKTIGTKAALLLVFMTNIR
jgi:hypothetical protein